MKGKIEKVRGTRDFYPEEKRIQNFIFDVWRDVALKYGYEEMDGPLIEPIELWHKKSGEEIESQMYTLVDKGGRKLVIRPEMTPTLARMVAQRQRELTKPIKWFSIQRFWRYEKPQSGRLREFWQINIDVVGTESILADAEITATAIEIMLRLGFTEKEFVVRINNRRLLGGILLQLGVQKNRIIELCRIIDKKDKVAERNFRQMLADFGLDEKTISKLNDVLESEDYLEKVDEKKLSEEGRQGLYELKQLIKYMKSFGLWKYCKLDLSMVRGIDYYTGNVMEVFDISKEFRAIAGGGRYDDLVAVVGGERCPGVGYAMGDVVLELFMRKKGKMPKLEKEIDFFIATTSESLAEKAVEIAQLLRKKYNVDIDLMNRKLAKQLKYADSVGAKKIVIVGEEELKQNKVKIKDMKTGKEELVLIEELKMI